MEMLYYFILVEAALLALVGGLCWNSYRISKLFKDKQREDVEIRGLGLIRGSVRSILALLIVGTYLNFAVFGYGMIIYLTEGKVDSFDRIYTLILASFTGIVGSVMGFYFGSRAAAPLPVRNEAEEEKEVNSGDNGN